MSLDRLQWIARCPHPEHLDNNPSLHIAVGRDGKVLLNCFVCAPQDKSDPNYRNKRKDWHVAVLRQLGLTKEDLIPDVCQAVEERLTPADNQEPLLYDLSESVAVLRHSVYTHLCEATGLTEDHRQQLENRGLSEESIKRNGYLSMQNVRAETLAGIHQRYFNDRDGLGSLEKVPGYDWGGFSPKRGLFIPCRDEEGRIITAQVRTDGQSGGKYLWLQGSRPVPHVPLGVIPGEEVWIAEGPLKADVATHLGFPCVAVPGIPHWRTILPLLKQWGTKKVVIAWDADRQRKPPVEKLFLAFANAIAARDIEVTVATWRESDGNGFDDLLNNGFITPARMIFTNSWPLRIGPKDAGNS